MDRSAVGLPLAFGNLYFVYIRHVWLLVPGHDAAHHDLGVFRAP